MSKHLLLLGLAALVLILGLCAISLQEKEVPGKPPIVSAPGTIDTVIQPADTIFVKSVRDSIKLQSLLDRTTRLERRVDSIYGSVEELYILLDGNADGLP